MMTTATGAADLLRIATAGSVDDGKSTLIGRLLYDSKQVLVDQLEQVEAASVRRHGEGVVDLSLLTDGLRAEREQGITIDVAYRYFTTGDRSFILADCPGHVQYTRNMVTGASTADLAIVLIDARNGVVEQTRRHTFISGLLGIGHVLFAINKMDLVDWDQLRFEEIKTQSQKIAKQLGIADSSFIPICALDGTNVVDRGDVPDWYEGPTLLSHLQTVQVKVESIGEQVRFPVQWVIRPGDAASPDLHDYRGYAGQLASGVLSKGDDVVVLPSGVSTKVAKIETFDGELDVALPPMSITVHLEDDVDVSRGDVIASFNGEQSADSEPFDATKRLRREFDADICWMSDRPLRRGERYLLKHMTTTTPVRVDSLLDRVDLDTLERVPVEFGQGVSGMVLNEIGRISLRTKRPLLADAYKRDRVAGAFVLIDEGTNDTVAAGMVV